MSRYKPLLTTIIEVRAPHPSVASVSFIVTILTISLPQDHVNNRLDQSLFPYVKDSPTLTPAPSLRAAPSPQATSLRSQKPSWHRAGRAGATQQDNKQRVLVFMAGGMTYSEMREAYLLSKSLNKDIYIGTFHNFLSPSCQRR